MSENTDTNRPQETFHSRHTVRQHSSFPPLTQVRGYEISPEVRVRSNPIEENRLQHQTKGDTVVDKLPGQLSERQLPSTRKDLSEISLVTSSPQSSMLDYRKDIPEIYLAPWEVWYNKQVQFTMASVARPHSLDYVLSIVRPLKEQLNKMSTDMDIYSNPEKRMKIPFPYAGIQIPFDRFELKDHCFEYMGRKEFGVVLQSVNKLLGQKYQLNYHLSGSLGWGKSTLLAVLVAVLSRDHRVIYIPHCQHLISKSVQYIKYSFYLAFADDESKLDQIRQFTSWYDLISFTTEEQMIGTKLLFVKDQIDTFDREPVNVDGFLQQRKDSVLVNLDEMTAEFLTIESSSANLKTTRRLRMYDGRNSLMVFGGLQLEEMQAWWKHCERNNQLPSILTTTELVQGTSLRDRRSIIEDLTGGNLILLKAVVSMAESPANDFDVFLWKLVQHEIFQLIRMEIWAFFFKRGKDKDFSYYTDLMHACLSQTSAICYNLYDSPDNRFFKISGNRKGVYSCGFARDTMASLLRLKHCDQFLGDQYYSALTTFRSNPSVVGFISEQIILTTISMNGLRLGEHHYVPNKTVVMDDFVFDHTADTCLYIPQRYNNAAINGMVIHLGVPNKTATEASSTVLRSTFITKPTTSTSSKSDVKGDKKKTALVMPIQITTAYSHSPSEEHFFQGAWHCIKDQLERAGYEATVHFVWITRKSLAHENIPFRVGKNLRHGELKGGHPSYNSTNLNIRQVNQRLGDMLESDKELQQS